MAPARWRSAVGAAGLALAAGCASAGGIAGAGGGATAQPATGAPAPPNYAALERDVLSELNAARTNPAAYAREVERLLAYFDGRVLRRPGDAYGISTQEGPAAVREAAAALRATSPRPALTRSPGMTEGARDHVEDQGPRGGLGHSGTDGSTTSARVNRYGRWLTRLTESISYGPSTGADVVQGLLVDDGVADRGHRRNLLDPAVRVAGIACGPHRQYRVMCVIDLAGGYEDR